MEDHNQKIVVEDGEIQQEQKVQMTFLKKSVDALHNKLQREQAEHARNRMAVMEINQDLIADIVVLQDKIKELHKDFDDAGGTKAYKDIKRKLAERDRMLDFIEQSEGGGAPMLSQNSLADASLSQVIDPAIQQQI